MRIAFAAAGNDEPPAGLQNRRRAAQNRLVIVHPMQGGVGKNQVKWRNFGSLSPPKRGEGF